MGAEMSKTEESVEEGMKWCWEISSGGEAATMAEAGGSGAAFAKAIATTLRLVSSKEGEALMAVKEIVLAADFTLSPSNFPLMD